MADINVAIIGLGNCASSLVQGVHKYADAGPDDSVPGTMHPVLGEYGIGDINVAAACPIHRLASSTDGRRFHLG